MCIEFCSSTCVYPIVPTSYVEDTFFPLVYGMDSFVTQRYLSTSAALPHPSNNGCILLSQANTSLSAVIAMAVARKGEHFLEGTTYLPPASTLCGWLGTGWKLLMAASWRGLHLCLLFLLSVISPKREEPIVFILFSLWVTQRWLLTCHLTWKMTIWSSLCDYKTSKE